jgi:hypothetical protein
MLDHNCIANIFNDPQSSTSYVTTKLARSLPLLVRLHSNKIMWQSQKTKASFLLPSAGSVIATSQAVYDEMMESSCQAFYILLEV